MKEKCNHVGIWVAIVCLLCGFVGLIFGRLNQEFEVSKVNEELARVDKRLERLDKASEKIVWRKYILQMIDCRIQKKDVRYTSMFTNPLSGEKVYWLYCGDEPFTE